MSESVVVQPVVYTVQVQADEYVLQVAAEGPQGPTGAGVPTGGAQYTILQQGSPSGSVPEWTSVLHAIDLIGLDTTAAQTVGVGEIAWNDTDGTLDVGLKGGNVTLQVGMEIVTLVKNADNAGLTNGHVVYIVGSSGANLLVRDAQADLEATAEHILGVMTESATGGNKAYCTTFGIVHEVDTSALTEGAPVYLSPTVAGGLTSTEPTAPLERVVIGVCIRSHATQGVLFVNVDDGMDIGELHDVLVTSPIVGQALTWSGSVWTNRYIPIQQAFSYTGTLTVYTGKSRFPITREGTIAHLQATLGTAAAGSGVGLRINVNGVSAGTLTIPAGSNTASTTLAATVHSNDYITVDVTSIGSTTAGADLTVLVTVE